MSAGALSPYPAAGAELAPHSDGQRRASPYLVATPPYRQCDPEPSGW